MKNRIKLLVSVMMLVVSFAVFTGCGAEEASDSKVSFSHFATKDLNGKDVNQDIFAGKKLTMINIWGTFCPPCIEEMPELGELSREFANKDVQIIGIVIDVSGADDKEHMDLAKKIVKDANVDFVNIYPDKELENALQDVSAVPTTFFVDSKGNVVGAPVIGADVKKYRTFMENYIK